MIKKLGFIGCIVIIYFYFMTTSIYGKSLEHIHINLKEEELAVTFLTSHNTKFLLIQSKDSNIGIILEAVSKINIKKEFPILNHEKIGNYILLDSNIKLKIPYQNTILLEDYIYFTNGILKRESNHLILTHDNKNLCMIYESGMNLDTCDYIYYYGLGELVEIPDTVKLVIYDMDVGDNIRLKNYDRFIDTIKLSYDYTTTLLWNESEYQTMILP